MPRRAEEAAAGVRRWALYVSVCGVLALSCGVKGPTLPREEVVPEPVTDLEVALVREGIEIRFFLPSRSLDGSSLREIGGYRIVREGPDGKRQVREENRFSVTEMRERPGQSVTTRDSYPERAGTYRYCVIPLDAYGSHPSKGRIRTSCWEGFLPGAAVREGLIRKDAWTRVWSGPRKDRSRMGTGEGGMGQNASFRVSGG